MLHPSRLMTLATVADRGSVVAAAEALHLTPSAISQQLKALESEAGVVLLDRSARQIRLTRAGLRMAARGRRITEELLAAGDDLAPWTDERGRILVVAAIQTVIRQVLAPILASGALVDDAIGLRVLELEGGEALRELHAGGVDLILAESHDDAEGDSTPGTEAQAGAGAVSLGSGRGVAARLVLEDRYQIIVPRTWEGGATPEQTRDALMADPWVAQAPETAGGRMIAELQRRWGFDANIAHVCTSYEAAVALVGAGEGAGVATMLALPVVQADAGVRVLENSPDLGMRRVTALTRASDRAVPAMETLLRAVADQAQQVGLHAQPTARRTG